MPRSVLLVALAASGAASAFSVSPMRRHHDLPCAHKLARTPSLIASAKIIPVAYFGVGCSLCVKACSAPTPVDGLVLVATGLLSMLNLATVDNQRYAGAKRAVKSPEVADLARQWYKIVRIHLAGQLAGLLWMVRARSMAAAYRGAALFMASNVLFFKLGAGECKHDKDGKPAPIKRELLPVIQAVDFALCCAASAAALCAAGSLGRAIASYVFAAGCLVGAVEGMPKTLVAIKGLVAGPGSDPGSEGA